MLHQCCEGEGSSWTAILIVDLDVLDEQTYAEYRQRVSATVATARGTYLARGGEIEVLEGKWRPRRIVVVRFDSVEAAQSWWAGQDYSELKLVRQRAAKTNRILLEGVSDA